MASFVLPLISGLAGLFGGGTQKTVNTSSNTTGSQQQQSSGGGSSSNTYNYNPLQQGLINSFSNSAQNQLNNATNLNPYTSQQLQNIGNQGNANASAISNSLASRGLSYSPAAATATTQNLLNTGNQQQQFLSQIPLLQNQLQTQAQQNAEAALKSQGINTSGTTTNYGSSQGTSNSATNGTQTTQGNPLAGLLGGLGGSLAAPSGQGTNNITQILQMLGLG